VAVAVVVVAAVVVVGVAYDGLIPGVQLPGGKGPAGSGSAGAVPYSTAKLAAMNAANSVQGGPWSVAEALAINSIARIQFPAFNGTGGSTVGCTISAASGVGPVSIGAASGGVGQGVSPFWEFLLTNSSGAGALVLVQNGSASVYATFHGSQCGLGLFSSVPATVVDSTTADASANAAGGSAFLQKHPLANATMVLVSVAITSVWAIEYATCSPTAASVAPADAFTAVVEASSGTVINATSTTTTCSGLAGGLGGGSPGGGGTPVLGTALAIASLGSGTCSGGGSSQTCAYRFGIVPLSSTLLPYLLTFSVQNASGVSENTRVANVTLLDSTGCAVGTFNFSRGVAGAWQAGPVACGSNSLVSPLVVGDTLSLLTVPSATPSLSGQGFHLVVMAPTSYSGTIYAAID
jgi:hypothetical protein